MQRTFAYLQKFYNRINSLEDESSQAVCPSWMYWFDQEAIAAGG